MKKTFLLILFYPLFCISQVNEINFNHQSVNFSNPPRTNINPMSIKLLDNYNNGGPTDFRTILEVYGLHGHQTSQLYFGGWDSSKIRYREAFWAQNTWSDWITMLDSKNDVESSGNLKITGSTNSYVLNGNLGIGTTIPDEKLTVKGKIHAQEVKVDMLGALVPDYVFTNDYKLKSLQETEEFIKKNNHLPEIPSAKEIEKNGLMLAEMNMSLLKKVEELTLYIIEINKRMQNLEQKKR